MLKVNNMKKKTIISTLLSLIALAAVIVLVLWSVPAMVKPSPHEAAESICPHSDAVVGGFTGQRELTEEEMELFRAVTQDSTTVFTPLSVGTQVVAGINYLYYCRYENQEGGGHCFVKVFRPLNEQPRILEIEYGE